MKTRHTPAQERYLADPNAHNRGQLTHEERQALDAEYRHERGLTRGSRYDREMAAKLGEALQDGDDQSGWDCMP
jgi:hypothetical protein